MVGRTRMASKNPREPTTRGYGHILPGITQESSFLFVPTVPTDACTGREVMTCPSRAHSTIYLVNYFVDSFRVYHGTMGRDRDV